MSWDERQRRMLAAMGLRVWARPEEGAMEPALAAAAQESLEPELALATAAEERSERVAMPAAAPVSVLQALPAELKRPSASPAQAPASPPVQAPADAGRAPAIAGMDWLQLQHSVGDCRACQLCEGRRGPEDALFGRGRAPVQCLVVGDMPGEQELAEAQAFGGQTGQLLGNMLRAIGLDPSEAAGQVGMVNALKCRSTPGRNPGAKELQQCEPYLQRQIELLQPQVILALGRMAVQSLLHTQEALGRLRGRAHHYQSIPVIVSFPPSYLLRNPADKARAWADLCLARRSLKSLGSGA
jgi:uracil-DNA glycosylase family 4